MIKSDNHQEVPLEWTGPAIWYHTSTEAYFSSEDNENVKLNVHLIVRKIKHFKEHPPNVFFRTHKYEIYIKPTEEFFTWAKMNCGFFVECQLMRKSSDNSTFHEYTECGLPVVQFAFKESVLNRQFEIEIVWPDKHRFNWKGEFCYQLKIFKRLDSCTYGLVTTMTSSSFSIYSKPSVYKQILSKPEKKRKNEEIETSRKKQKKNHFYNEIDTDKNSISHLLSSENFPINSKNEFTKLLNIKKEDDMYPKITLTPPMNLSQCEASIAQLLNLSQEMNLSPNVSLFSQESAKSCSQEASLSQEDTFLKKNIDLTCDEEFK